MKKKLILKSNLVNTAIFALCTGASMPAFAQVEAKIVGRVHYDIRNIDSGDLNAIDDKDTASIADGYEMRRTRIGVQGSIDKDLQFEAVANAVGSTTNIIDTAFINYGYIKDAQVRVGRFKQPFSLEENTSSNNIDFMERSYVNQLLPGKQLGAMFHGYTNSGFTYAFSAYQNGFNELTAQTPSGSTGALRLTSNLVQLANWDTENSVFHIGLGLVGGSYEQTTSTSTNTADASSTTTRGTVVSFRDENRGLSNAYRLQIGGDKIGTAAYGASGDTVTSVDQTMRGVELALANGPFKFQAEYASSRFDATHSKCTWTAKVCASGGTATLGADVDAQYVSVLWNITGEKFAKTYSRGSFGGIKPNAAFMKDYGGVVGNGMGAWQVAYRVSQYSVSVDQAVSATSGTEYTLTDGSTSTASRYQNSPKATTQTVGLNWFLNSNARVMFNYSKTVFGSSVEALDTNNDSSTTKFENIFAIRTQINF